MVAQAYRCRGRGLTRHTGRPWTGLSIPRRRKWLRLTGHTTSMPRLPWTGQALRGRPLSQRFRCRHGGFWMEAFDFRRLDKRAQNQPDPFANTCDTLDIKGRQWETHKRLARGPFPTGINPIQPRHHHSQCRCGIGSQRAQLYVTRTRWWRADGLETTLCPILAPPGCPCRLSRTSFVSLAPNGR